MSRPSHMHSGDTWGTALDERELYRIAEDIGTSDKIIPLGLKLGFNRSKIKLYQQTNTCGGISFEGTWHMLCDWKESVPQSEQRSSLLIALTEAKLLGIAEKHLK